MFYKAYDSEWRNVASTGGIVRGSASWLLKNGHIKSIIGVLQGETPGEFYWGMTCDPGKLAKSVYKVLDPTPLLDTLSAEDKSEALFIGLPCQVAKDVKYKITLLCSGHQRGDSKKTIADFRYGIKPDNFGVLYTDGTYELAQQVHITPLKESCRKCRLPYKGDLIVGDLHGTPFNLVETMNPIFDEYIKTVRHKELSEAVYSILKLDN